MMETVEVKEEQEDPLASDDELITPEVEVFEDKLYCCQVCNMILIDFSKCSAEEQAKILEKGRPTPKMATMAFNTPQGYMSCFSMNKYDTYEWLTGCEERGRLFCWPCLLFSKDDDQLRKTGFPVVPNFPYALKTHANLKSHIDSMIKWKMFGKVYPSINDDGESLEYEECNKRLKEKVITKNREILKKLIRVFCFLSVHELCSPLAVGEEPTDPIDQSKYEQLLSFIGRYDDFLEKQLSLDKRFLNPTVRRDVISSISDVVTREVVREVSQVNFVSFIVDEVAEMGNTTLISTIVRYVGPKGELIERFLNFKQVLADRQADSLFYVINENVALLECHSKVVSLSCDGGVVDVNEISMLQTKVKNLCPNIHFLHYFEHKLISVLAQSLSTIKLCKLFFFTLNGLAMSFLKSNKLSYELNSIIRSSKPKAKDFRWSFNGRLIDNVNGIRQSLIILFKGIMDNKEDWDFETVIAASTFLPILTSDLPFNFLLLFLGDIFTRAERLSSLLAAKSGSIGLCLTNVKDYTKVIKNKRDTFSQIYNEALRRTDLRERNTKNKNMSDSLNDNEEMCRLLTESIIRNLILQLNSRFGDLANITFLSVIDFRRPVSPLLTPLPKNFDTLVLQAELNILWESSAFKGHEPRLMLRKLRLKKLDSVLHWTDKLCELSLCLPVSKGDSTLERVENYIQTTSLSHRLSPLAVLKVKKEIVEELSRNQKFYDDVISVFAEKEPSIPLLITE